MNKKEKLANLLIEASNKLDPSYTVGDYTIKNVSDNNGENYYLLKYKNNIISRHDTSKDAEDEIKEREKKIDISSFDKLIMSKEKELEELKEKEKTIRSSSDPDKVKELVDNMKEQNMITQVIESAKSMKNHYNK